MPWNVLCQTCHKLTFPVFLICLLYAYSQLFSILFLFIFIIVHLLYSQVICYKPFPFYLSGIRHHYLNYPIYILICLSICSTWNRLLVFLKIKQVLMLIFLPFVFSMFHVEHLIENAKSSLFCTFATCLISIT